MARLPQPQQRHTACDECNARKVKCDGGHPCVVCRRRKETCTYNKVHKKSGPKGARKKLTENNFKTKNGKDNLYPQAIDGLKSQTPLLDSDYISCDISPVIKIDPRLTFSVQVPDRNGHLIYKPAALKIIPSNVLIKCLSVYEKWFYNVWPVVSIDHLIGRLKHDEARLHKARNSNNGVENGIKHFELLEAENKFLQTYSLVTAMCATNLIQMSFLNDPDSYAFAQYDMVEFVAECLKARHFLNYKEKISYTNLLTAFFLSNYYINVVGYHRTAIIYLREAISFAHVLGLHKMSKFKSKTVEEQHLLSKIYYMLFVTERFTSIQYDIPVVLYPTIDLPTTDFEPEPERLIGFINIIKVFSVPDNSFFDNWNEIDHNRITKRSKEWLRNIQNNLENVQLESAIVAYSDLQKANVLVTQNWMRTLTWQLCVLYGYLSPGDDHVMAPSLPLSIVRDLLISTSNLHHTAHEANGPGLQIKLFEVANSLSDVIYHLSRADEVVQRSPLTVQAYDMLKTLAIRIFKLPFKWESNNYVRGLAEKIESVLRERGITHICWGLQPTSLFRNLYYTQDAPITTSFRRIEELEDDNDDEITAPSTKKRRARKPQGSIKMNKGSFEPTSLQNSIDYGINSSTNCNSSPSTLNVSCTPDFPSMNPSDMYERTKMDIVISNNAVPGKTLPNVMTVSALDSNSDVCPDIGPNNAHLDLSNQLSSMYSVSELNYPQIAETNYDKSYYTPSYISHSYESGSINNSMDLPITNLWTQEFDLPLYESDFLSPPNLSTPQDTLTMNQENSSEAMFIGKNESGSLYALTNTVIGSVEDSIKNKYSNNTIDHEGLDDLVSLGRLGEINPI